MLIGTDPNRSFEEGGQGSWDGLVVHLQASGRGHLGPRQAVALAQPVAVPVPAKHKQTNKQTTINNLQKRPFTPHTQ